MRDLEAVLEAGKSLGLLGPGPVERHIAHAHGFAEAIGEVPGLSLDLGTGAGVPGAILALALPGSRWVLLDASRRRAAFAAEAVRSLGLSDRVEVVARRAEEAGRDETMRGAFGLVVARAFGPPAAVAECAAPFLAVGGRLVVSEPPDEVPHSPAQERPRWPAEGVSLVGLAVDRRWEGYQTLVQVKACPDRFPRRVGMPARRPLF